MQNRLWVITTYYNFSSSPYREANYWEFRRNLKQPLILVEYSVGDRFELGPGAADIHVPVRGDALLWQKERLLNHALRYLPEECEAIAWIDCDLVLPRTGWAEDCLEKLTTARMVQLFTRVIHLPSGGRFDEPQDPKSLFFEEALAGSIANGADLGDVLYVKPVRENGQIVNGMAWAAERALIETNGLFDACIVGGGDTAVAAAALGAFDAVIAGHRMNLCQQAYYLRWARRFWERVRGRVTALDQDIYHLWHGSMGARRSRERHLQLAETGYDPVQDLRIDPEGAWRLAGSNRLLRRFLSGYFRAR